MFSSYFWSLSEFSETCSTSSSLYRFTEDFSGKSSATNSSSVWSLAFNFESNALMKDFILKSSSTSIGSFFDYQLNTMSYIYLLYKAYMMM